jgi:hypothetical protein
LWVHALLDPHRDGRRGHLPVQLVLSTLKLEVANQHPRQQSREEKAHRHDAGGRGKEPEAECQLPASSSR